MNDEVLQSKSNNLALNYFGKLLGISFLDVSTATFLQLKEMRNM